MAVVADLEVKLRFRRPRLPGRAAGAAGLYLEILGMDPFLHGWLLRGSGKGTVYQTSHVGRSASIAIISMISMI
jgi:hypothetical protein